ncbi:ABC transporter ATP-binding protein [Halorubrum sp. SP3]|uniref:ABC transporter ATP-binding protein n=1 Tax=Halorubrum sp. SP3 TaxID=1537265 RepID=UPI0010FA4BE0|nr:ABC transporter ATP-binding protein [Halorubrum sp. SP3]TKX55047.1 ABC transporter ATP-binding protein [Halorubrum sp. SP3]
MRIDATDVRKTYGDVTALDGLSLSVPSGSTFGIIGTNGAGKSTLFRLLVGHDRPDAGTVSVGGTDVTEDGRRVRRRVGYLPEHVGFPDGLTGREALGVHRAIRGLPKDGRIAEAIERVGLTADEADRRVSGYSNGMQRRLGLATVLLPDPDVLVLDEPTAGLDPRGVDEFHAIVEDITAETDATVVFCSHVLPEVERLCDRAAVLHDGRVRAAGPVDELAAGADAGDPETGDGEAASRSGRGRGDLRAAFRRAIGDDAARGARTDTEEVAP